MARDSDAWPDEPEEADPEERWGDPERDLVQVPSVDVPSVEDEDVDIDSELATAFWVTVVLVNVTVAGVSIGAMLLYFRGAYLVGGGAVALGVLASLRAYTYYRTFRAEREESD